MSKKFNFISKSKGNTAILFAFLAIPLTIGFGSGVDIARKNYFHANLQSASDAALLQAIKDGKTATQTLEDKANTYVKLNIEGEPYTNLVTDLINDTGPAGEQLKLNTSARVPTLFLAAFGTSYFDISVSSAAVTSSPGSEVVFVLDTTGSMDDNNKMTSLKSSMTTILNNMLDSNGNNINNIKVGIVPFAQQVRIAESTTNTYVNYGQALNYQYCDHGNSFPSCPVYWNNYDIVCKTSTNIAACKNTITVYQRPVYTNNNRYFYEQIAKAYTVTGTNKYTIHTHRMLVSYTDDNLNFVFENNRPRLVWDTNTVRLDDDTQTDVTNQSNLDSYNAVPTYVTNRTRNFTKITSVKYELKYWLNNNDYWYDNGYGASSAISYNYNIFNNTNTNRTRTVDIPAVTDKKSEWKGCLSDRTQPYDVSADSPSSAPDSLYVPRPCLANGLATVLPLTTNINDAKNKVNSFTPDGYTNITIGIQYGIEVLSPSAPETGGVAYNHPEYKKYMVIITDGYNTRNRFTNTSSEIDARTALACQAAKAKGITLFVVRLEEGNSQLLEDCASQPPYYYDLDSGTQLEGALKDMFTAINKTRLTQ